MKTPLPTDSPTDYLYHRSVFRQQFLGLIHGKLELARIFRPGIYGYPVLDSFPFVLWKPRWVLHEGAHRQADRFFPLLYRSLIRHAERQALCKEDAEVLAGLVLYAVFRYRFEWIYSLADLVRTGRVQSDNGTEIVKIAALLSALQGARPRAVFFAHLVARPDPYFAHLFGLLTGKEISAGDASERPSAKRLLWFEAARTNDLELEKQLIRKFMKNSPLEEEELLDIHAALLARGHLFRACRLLLRHCGMTGEKPHLLSVLLHHYLLNGKYLLFLRRLGRMEKLPSRKLWYAALFAIQMIAPEENPDVYLEQLYSHRPDAVPQDETFKEEFRIQIAAASRGHRPNLLRKEKEADFLLFFYLFSSEKEGRSERIKEKFRLFEELLESRKGRAERPNLERLALFFPVLEEKFRIYESRKSVQALWPLLQGLAGRSLPVRKFLGLSAFAKGYKKVSFALLRNLPLFAAEELHARAELSVDFGNFSEAIRDYEILLKKNPNSAFLYFNYGLLLESTGQEARALAAYERALKIEPSFRAARDKIEVFA